MDFKDLGGVTLEKLDAYIKLCDAVVHLVGDLTGAAACKLSTEAILSKYPGLPRKFPPLGKDLEKGEPISYTQWEAWLALYHSKVLLIAKADNDAPRGLAYAPTDCSRMAQEKHLARLREVERYPGNVFTSPDNLAKQIALTTILDLLAKAQSTSRQFSGSNLAKPIDFLVAAALCVLAIWLAARQLTRLVPEGPLRTLFIVVVGLWIAAIPTPVIEIQNRAVLTAALTKPRLTLSMYFISAFWRRGQSRKVRSSGKIMTGSARTLPVAISRRAFMRNG
jgi:hypothetical protein